MIILYFLIHFFTSLFSTALSDPRASESRLYCGSEKEQTYSQFIPKFVEEMYSLSQMINTQNFATHSITNSTQPPMYGLVQCFGDLTRTDCQLCFAAGRASNLPSCIPSVSAVLFMDGCFLRYDNYNFYNEFLDSKIGGRNCSSNSLNKVDDDENVEFGKGVKSVIEKALGNALRNGGFWVGEAKVERGRRRKGDSVFALAQCWESVKGNDCRDCLRNVSEEARQCLPSRDGRGMNVGCYFRYSSHKFYNDPNHGGHHGKPKPGVMVAIFLSSAAMLILLAFSVFLGLARYSKWKKGESEINQRFAKLGMSFKYEVLEEATNFFNPSNKLGQGGAGIVFKGTLPNGQIVAVKRLFLNTSQYRDEFFNEVNLIHGIQHKNLVKLLGCSIEGPESLLVYEFAPNKSLDHYIFGRNGDHNSLNWKQRLNIIVGTAKGLAYLHGGAQVRIIHRDIKCSNVLLGEDFTPKIADFGLVRYFASGKTHLSTGVAGTLGYMAPEYLVRGQLTEKADVYSFGVLVLEVICGRKNTFLQDLQSLVQHVWNLFNLENLSKCVDPNLSGDDSLSKHEVEKVLQIGLLCTQASVPSRPSMAQVVDMLTCENCEIPMPNQPPFLNTNLLD